MMMVGHNPFLPLLMTLTLFQSYIEVTQLSLKWYLSVVAVTVVVVVLCVCVCVFVCFVDGG